MYEVEFFHDQTGKSEIIEYLDELNNKGKTSKNERINRDKILAYILALKQYGTRIGHPVVKHIDGSLWELRPLANRIFFSFTGKIINLFYYTTLLKKREKHHNLK